MQNEPRMPTRVFPLSVDDTGRMVLPRESQVRRAVRAGEKLVGVEEADGTFRVKTHAEVIREIQDYAAQFIPPGVSLVDELLQERREEAARE